MTKSIRGKKCSSRQLRSHNRRLFSQCNFKRVANKELAATEKCAWKDSICPVCLECPHNAVLLLCSSHDKGCRPYICATNYHHSNCLDQLIDSRRSSKDCEDLDSIELTCPLCRGEVKGYTLVEPAREQLNQNKRSCMQDGCSYMGSYGELCKHVRKKHPSVKPHSVDPVHTYRWRRLLFRSSLQDMICATSSPMVRRVLYVMLQFEELMASVWHEGPHGAMQINEMNLADPWSQPHWNVRISYAVLAMGSVIWAMLIHHVWPDTERYSFFSFLFLREYLSPSSEETDPILCCHEFKKPGQIVGGMWNGVEGFCWYYLIVVPPLCRVMNWSCASLLHCIDITFYSEMQSSLAPVCFIVPTSSEGTHICLLFMSRDRLVYTEDEICLKASPPSYAWQIIIRDR